MKLEEFYLDYRFIAKAKDQQEALEKVEKFLPDSTPDIWFTIIQTKKKEAKET